MFKSWHIFVFSLVPLALVFAGVITGSMFGVDSELQEFPTQTPREENGAGNGGNGEGPTPVPGATTIELVAVNLTWGDESLSAPAGEPVAVVMDNQDSGVLHNFSLYVDRGFTQPIFQGELVTGPVEKTYTFDAPSTPGTFFFRCDVHPDTMTGQFAVN